jgi:RNA polymerase sigma-70 factor (ECF subfamily)
MDIVMNEVVSVPGDVDERICTDKWLRQSAPEDATAFGEFYKQYVARVYSYMRTRISGDEEAADLTAQVFLKAWQALPMYHDRGVPFPAWLFRIARNVATDAYRRERVTVSWDRVPEGLHPTTADDPEAIVLRQEAATRVRALVAGLEPKAREIIMLRFVAGLTLREIALVIDKSEATVHKQIALTLHTLKERSHER